MHKYTITFESASEFSVYRLEKIIEDPKQIPDSIKLRVIEHVYVPERG
jgi:hypothetical protein